MSRTVFILFLLLCLHIPLYAGADDKFACIVFPAVKTPKNDYREETHIEPSVLVSPNEVYYGDSIFILHRAKNLNSSRCMTDAVPGVFDFKYNGLDYTLTAEGIDEKYHPMWESPSSAHYDYFSSMLFLEPDETGTTSGVELELPPLEDWDTPFWKTVRENLPREGRKLTLTFSRSTGKDQRSDLGSVEILLKPRPRNEMEKLQIWFDALDEQDLPVERNLLYGYPVKGPRVDEKPKQISLSLRGEVREMLPEESRKSVIELGGKSYPVSSFIRFPRRKPPKISAPTTLEGWRNLRDSFQKSILRTELELTVLKMEYLDVYQPDNTTPQTEKRDEIIRWIRTQPEFMQTWWVKRTQPVATLEANPYGREVADKQRNERGVEFLRLLYPMSDPVNRQEMRWLIPEMKEEDERKRDERKIAQGITEKEKTEGYRFWFLQTGKLLCKGKLIAIGETRVMIKEEHGSTYTSTIETLSEADRQYIHEKNNDPRWSPDLDDRNVEEFLDKEKVREFEQQQIEQPQGSIEKGKVIRTYPSSGGEVYSLSYSSDGTMLLSTGKDKTARLWDPKTGKLIRAFRGHASAIKSGVISPDRKHVLTMGDQDRTARLWDIQSGEEIQQIPISNWNPGLAVFFPDGKHFFATADLRTVCMFSVETGENLISYQGHENYIRSLAISPDGLQLLTGSEDKTVKLWDIDSGKEIWSAELGGRTSMATFSPDGKSIIAGSHDRGIKLLDIETGDVIKDIVTPQNATSNHFAVSPDGKELICQAFGPSIHVFSFPEGKFRRGFMAHGAAIHDMVFAPDGKSFATCSADGSLKIWGLKTVQWEWDVLNSRWTGDQMPPIKQKNNDVHLATPLINITPAGYGAIQNVRISPDGTHILFFDDTTPRVLGKDDGKERFHVNPERTPYMLPALEFLADGKNVFIYNFLYETSTGIQGKFYNNHQWGTSLFYSLAFTKDGKRFVGGDRITQTHYWDFDSGKPDKVFQNIPNCYGGSPADYNTYTAFLADDTKILSVRRTGEVFLWDIASREMTRPFGQNHSSSNHISSVAHSTDEKYIVLCNHQGKTVFLRSLQDGRLVKTFNGHEEKILTVVFSPDSKYLLTGSADKTARLWDIENGQCVKILEGHEGSVLSVTFSADGKQILTGSEDGTAILWE